MREHFTTPGVNAWLDTPAGVMMSAQCGSRQAAISALAEADAADRAWRRQQAIRRAEMFPGRYASVDDAMIAIPDPAGGFAAQLEGTTDDIVAAVRRVDPTQRVKNLGGDLPDGAVSGIAQGPVGGPHAADTRPPWQREG